MEDAVTADLLILALVLSPLPVPLLPRDASPELWQSLHRFNELNELWSPKGRYLASFADEISWTRSAYRGCRNAPPISDADRFPSADICRAQCQWWCRRLTWLRARLEVQPWRAAEYDQPIKDAAWCEETFRLMADVHSGEWCARRLALLRLRLRLGPQAYYEGF